MLWIFHKIAPTHRPHQLAATTMLLRAGRAAERPFNRWLSTDKAFIQIWSCQRWQIPQTHDNTHSTNSYSSLSLMSSCSYWECAWLLIWVFITCTLLVGSQWNKFSNRPSYLTTGEYADPHACTCFRRSTTGVAGQGTSWSLRYCVLWLLSAVHV